MSNEQIITNKNHNGGFNQNTQKPPLPKKSVSIGSLRAFYTSRRFLIGVLVFLVIAIPTFLFIIQKRNQTPPDVLLATAGTQKIYKSQVETAAKQQYIPSAIDKKVLQTFLNTLIERAILDQEAKKLGITASQEEIHKNILFTTNKGGNKQALSDFVKYSILKDKIMAKETKNVQAYIIGFWIAPFGYPQQPKNEALRVEAKKAFPEAGKMLEEGKPPLDVLQYIADNYPNLKIAVGMNGYNFSRTPNKEVFIQPYTYILDKKVMEETNSLDFYITMIAMKPGEVKVIIPTDGSGASVIKLVNISQNGFVNYSDFLQVKKKELVTISNNL